MYPTLRYVAEAIAAGGPISKPVPGIKWAAGLRGNTGPVATQAVKKTPSIPSILSVAIKEGPQGVSGWGVASALALPRQAGAGFGGVVAMMATGAFAGGTASYMTGGSFTQGAMAGMVGGTFAYKSGRSLASAGAYMMRQGRQAGTRRFGAQLHGIGYGMSSRANRRMAFGVGATMGGMAFGGERRSHKRGFNSQRGNYIGHA